MRGVSDRDKTSYGTLFSYLCSVRGWKILLWPDDWTRRYLNSGLETKTTLEICLLKAPVAKSTVRTQEKISLSNYHTPVICCCTLLAFQNFCTLSFLPLAKVNSTGPKSSKLLRRRKRRTAPFSFAALSLGIWAMTTPRERSLKKWANNERVQTGCCKSLPRHSS